MISLHLNHMTPVKQTSGLQEPPLDENSSQVGAREHTLVNLTPLLVHTAQLYSSPHSSKVQMTRS